MLKKLLLSAGVFLGFLFTAQAQYCVPVYTSSCTSDDYLDLFTTTGGLTNITTNVSTGCNNTTNNYTYHATSSMSQVQGQTISFSIQGGSIWTSGFRIWVDWNNDQDFVDAGEDVWNSATTGTNLFTGSLTIPLSASPGVKRLRVRQQFSGVPTDPCTSLTFGEAEDFNLTVLSLGPCLAVPYVGIAKSTKGITCSGESFTLSVDSMTFGSGQLYQWQTSVNGTVWTNMVNDTNLTKTLSQTTTNSYRLRVICSGGTPVFSAPVTVTTTAVALPAGTYTINSGLATGGSNFISFSDFKQAIVCGGIAGPIVVNVTANSAGYNEQIKFGVIGGASATNTITINGNGALLTFGGGAADRATLTLDGTKYIKIKKLTIEGTATSNSYGVELRNNAQYVTFDSCTVRANLAATSSTVAAFVTSNSATSPTTSGLSASNLTVKNSIIEGGYYCFIVNGPSAAPWSTNNLIENNIVRDFYLYGMYVGGQENSTFKNNDIHRMNATAITTFYGMYVTGGVEGTQFVGNRIHNTNDSGTPITTNYVMYITNANGTATNPATFANNVIYNINNTGTIYGMYIPSGNYLRFYHNTINLNNSAPAASTGIVRAIYVGASSGNFEFKNNLISVSIAGSGAKNLVYLSSTTPTYVFNYNQYSLTSTGGSNTFGYYGAAVADFTAWKAVNSAAFDQNSIYGTPIINPADNFSPQSPAGNAAGTNLLASVPTDIFGVARTTTPDIGAVEFTPLSCLQPINIVGTPTNSSVAFTWVNDPSGDSIHIEYGPTGFNQGTGNDTTLVGSSGSVTGLMDAVCYDFYITTWCNGVMGSGTALVTYCTKCNPSSLPYTEAFTTWLPLCFELSTTGTWDWIHNATGVAYANFWGNSTGSATMKTREVSITSPAEVRIKWAHQYNTSYPNDRMIVRAQKLGTTQWDTLINFSGSTFNSPNATTSTPPPSATDYVQTIVPLPLSYLGGVGKFEIIGTTGWGPSLFIDEFIVGLQPQCAPPIGVNATVLTSSGATINWSSAFGNCFKMEYGPQGFTHSTGQGTVVQNATSPRVITGLSPNTYYDVYLFDCCDTLAPSIVYTFRTNCLVQLNGTYTVGGTPGPNNYTTLSAAIQALQCGVSGPVTFNIAARTDTLAINLKAIQGVTATNTLTINGAGKALTKIIIPSGILSGLTLDGASNITFKNLTIDGSAANRVVWLTNNAQYITFDNCNLWHSTSSVSSLTAVVAASGSETSTSTAGNNASNIVIKNCNIRGAYYGINLYGTSTTVQSSNFKIEGCTFDTPYYYAIQAYYVKNVEFTKNTAVTFGATGGYGIYAYYVDNFKFNANNIKAPTYGIYLSQGNTGGVPAVKSEVINNMIIGASYAVYMPTVNSYNMYHNSMVGNTYGAYLSSNTLVDIRNNIFKGNTYSIYATPAITGAVVNNNIYYGTGTNLAYWGAARATLAAWQTADPTLNTNSLAGDPGFLSATDLHIVGTLPNNVGVNGLATVDIDGDTRPFPGSSTVDIGADEFTPLNWDVSVEGMIVALGGCGDAATEVKLIVKNFGLSALTSVPMTVQVTGGVTTTITQTASVSIATGATDTLLVGTFNTYSGPTGVMLKGFTNLGTDQKRSNDTVVKGPGNYFPVEPRTHTMVDTVCGSIDSVDLYALNVPGANYGWFAAAVGGTALANGDTFRVPTSGQKTYYVQYTSSSANVEFGTGSLASSSTLITPYKTFYMDGRVQYMILASELMAQGVAGGLINSLQFEVSGAPNAQTMTDFNIKMGGTSLTSMAGGYVPTTGFTNVYSNVSYSATAGWNTHTFSTPFVWNGSDNVIVEVCFDNNAYGNNTNVTYDVTPFVSVYDGYQDNVSGSVCGTVPSINSSSSNRPRIRFNATTTACSAIRKPVSFAVKAGSVANAAFVATVQPNGATVNFDATTSQGITYDWNYGDGNSGTGVTTSHTYALAGSYNVRLIVTENVCNSADTIFKNVIATVGIEESLLGQSLNVYPNPNNGAFRVSFMVEGVKHTNIRIMNTMGQLMYDYTPGNISGAYNQDINLSREAAGVYILQITTDDGIISRRITINK